MEEETFCPKTPEPKPALGGEKPSYVFIDKAGEIWWQPADYTKAPQLLADADSLCGIWILNTGEDDEFRDECSWHDHAYRNRAWYEYMGLNVHDVNSIFFRMMMRKAKELSRKDLQDRAWHFYRAVELIGPFFWNRHPAWDGKTVPNLPVL